VLEGEQERDPELVVAEGPPIVGHADEPGRGEQRPAVQRHPGHLGQRRGGEGEHEQQRRSQVGQADQPAAPAPVQGGPAVTGWQWPSSPPWRRRWGYWGVRLWC